MSSLYRSRRWGFEGISAVRQTGHGLMVNPAGPELTGYQDPALRDIDPWVRGRQPSVVEERTCSLFPLWVQLQGEDRIFQLSEEPLQHIRDILNEVVTDAQLDIAGIPPELLHQYLDPGLGSILAVNPLMPQPWDGDMGS